MPLYIYIYIHLLLYISFVHGLFTYIYIYRYIIVSSASCRPAFQQRCPGTAFDQFCEVMRRDAEKAKDYAKRHGVPKWYTSVEDIPLPGADITWDTTERVRVAMFELLCCLGVSGLENHVQNAGVFIQAASTLCSPFLFERHMCRTSWRIRR